MLVDDCNLQQSNRIKVFAVWRIYFIAMSFRTVSCANVICALAAELVKLYLVTLVPVYKQHTSTPAADCLSASKWPL